MISLISYKQPEIMKRIWTISLILALALAGITCSAGIEYGRSIYDGELSNSGHSWAGYAKHCGEDQFAIRFNFNNLTGGVQANLNLNRSNRYAVGIVDQENGTISTYLFRQKDGKIEHAPGMTISYDPSAIYQVEITHDQGEVQVTIKKIPDESAIKVIDYFDADPLPAGVIDFETLENSSVSLREVAVSCLPPVKEENHNMGVAHFKPPE
jgi:hypothetical protein